MGTVRIFNHYIKTAILVLGGVEAAALIAAVYAGALVRFDGEATQMLNSVGPLWPKAVFIAFVVMLGMTATGLYERRLREGPLGIVRRLIVSFAIAVALMSVAFYLMPQLYLGRGALALACVLAFVAITLTHLVFLQVRKHQGIHRRTLVLGAGHRAASLTGLRRGSDRFGLGLVGYVKTGGVNPEIDADKVIELDEPLSDYASRHRIDEIVVALDDRRNSLPVNDLLECRMRGVEVTDLLSFFERETGKVKVDLMYPSWLAYSNGSFYRGSLRQFIKRLFDLVVSTVMLVLTGPIMALTAILIVAETGAPILYRQKRVGESGRIFEVYKFRSMVQDAERTGAQWASEDDPRITRVGAVIRTYRIDELPQLFNVLKGEMSFVGPRPERPELVGPLRRNLPYYAERHRVKPGITGWAQIRYPYGASERDAFEKLQFDLYYVKNYSIFFDLFIMLQTTEVIVWGKGAR